MYLNFLHVRYATVFWHFFHHDIFVLQALLHRVHTRLLHSPTPAECMLPQWYHRILVFLFVGLRCLIGSAFCSASWWEKGGRGRGGGENLPPIPFRVSPPGGLVHPFCYTLFSAPWWISSSLLLYAVQRHRELVHIELITKTREKKAKKTGSFLLM